MADNNLSQNTSMPTRKTNKQKKKFVSPQIVELGSAAKLIQGGSGTFSEDGTGTVRRFYNS